MSHDIEHIWLRSFHAVYSLQSFKKAAEQLELPTSNVSRHISLLESKLSIKLLQRTTRKVTPTEAGEQLYEDTSLLLKHLDNALDKVKQQPNQISGHLKILMPDSPVLASAIVSFCQQYPKLSISCETTLSPKQEQLADFDLILSFNRGEIPEKRWVAKEIMRWQSCVVASPKLLEKVPLPTQYKQLSQLPCITTLTAASGVPWVFKSNAGQVKIKVESNFKVNSGSMAKQGALAGLGFAILPLDSCRQEIEQQHLAVVPLDRQPADLVLYAFHAEHPFVARKVTLLVNHLIEFAQHT